MHHLATAALNNLINIFWALPEEPYECSSNGAFMLHGGQVGNRRGEELLDELVGIRPVYTISTAKMIWNFRRSVLLLLKYWNDVKANVENGNTEYRSEFIRILDRMATSHDTTNAPVACGVRVADVPCQVLLL